MDCQVYKSICHTDDVIVGEHSAVDSQYRTSFSVYRLRAHHTLKYDAQVLVPQLDPLEGYSSAMLSYLIDWLFGNRILT